ncbi:tetratricopeptide repeat protein [Novipirellula sp. SH528]|uniref:tetratricopeptide repeat protein n=1 Tax=Novipirellula sp. SH528 TaxID=3454466 RepID=UPI003FA1163F
MFFHQLIVAATIASSMITPSVSPSRPRTARLSRGPAWTDFRSLAMSHEAQRSAKEMLEGKKRIAVVVLSNQQDAHDSPSDVSVFGTLVREGMRFSDQLVLVDTSTTDRLFADAGTVDAARSVAEEHHIDLIVCCQLRTPSEIEMVLVKDDSQLEPTVISLDDANQSVIAAAMKARTHVMTTFDALPTKHQDAIDLAPNGSLAAVKLWFHGTRLLRSVVTIQDPAKRKEICQAILSTADQALADSPNFIEAYLLKASCFDELGDEERLNQTLLDAYSKRNPKRDSPFTILELEGDYARFVDQDLLAAMETYDKILTQNPTDLTALWSLIDVALSSGTDKETVAMASELAALLVASHPDSNVARAIQTQ